MPIVGYGLGPALGFGVDAGLLLQNAQGGNADSTNIADRGPLVGGGVVQITSVVGATPTVTVNLQGSIDSVNWWNVPYALIATPRTFVVSAITITSAVVTPYLLQELVFWRYFKLVMSANTNVTLTSIFWSH